MIRIHQSGTIMQGLIFLALSFLNLHSPMTAFFSISLNPTTSISVGSFLTGSEPRHFPIRVTKKPYEYISRIQQTDEILEDFNAEHPVSQVYMLTGVRGSGKTVLMSAIANHLSENDDWIVVELNPTRNLLQGLASNEQIPYPTIK